MESAAVIICSGHGPAVMWQADRQLKNGSKGKENIYDTDIADEMQNRP